MLGAVISEKPSTGAPDLGIPGIIRARTRRHCIDGDKPRQSSTGLNLSIKAHGVRSFGGMKTPANPQLAKVTLNLLKHSNILNLSTYQQASGELYHIAPSCGKLVNKN